jgi:MYXO-CTERM domain-containing protein
MTILPLILALPTADAYSSGKTGSSTSGCGSCHGSSADSTTGVVFSAEEAVAPGDVVDVSLEVSTTSSSRSAAGLDVSVSGGSLSAGSNNKVSSGEITHTGRTAMSGGAVSFDFTWTAPSTEGTYTFYGAGNAVDQNYGSSGDGWNTATFVITVSADYADEDGDGYLASEDCNDADAAINPDAEEVCDEVDNDCDAEIDEGLASTWYADSDGDGYGDDASAMEDCQEPTGYVQQGGDCDDADADAYPDAEEVLDDGVDQDCDGEDAVSDVKPGGEDTSDPEEEEEEEEDEEHEHDTGEDDDKGCATVSGGGGLAALLGLVALVGRRRRMVG